MDPRNVIILHTDQQRYDSLGCAGNPYARTPNLDRLAAQGTLFTRHIASNSVCMPSRASLVTGLYPPGHNVWSNGIALNRKEYLHASPAPRSTDLDLTPQPPTLADMFARAGYDTVSFGKLHLTPNLAPTGYGYPETWAAWQDGALDEWHGPYYGFRYVDITKGHGEQPCQAGHYGAWLQRQHPDVYRQVVQNREHVTLPVPTLRDLYPSPLPVELHHSAWLADRLCRYLECERSKDRPFFAFVGFPDPHHPFTPCREAVDLFAGQPVKDPSDESGQGIADSPLRHRYGMDIGHLTTEERRIIIRYTYAMIYQIDLAVGRIVDALQQSGLWQDTIVVFTSDHGDFLGDHGRLRKGVVAADALLHVPFILHASGAGLPGQVDLPMSNCDVMPTLAALTGVQPPDWQHGRDVTALIREGEVHHALAFCANGVPANVNHTIYDADYRLTYYPYWGFCELYDHRSDPDECTNLAARAHPRARALMEVLGQSMLRYHNPILGRTAAW